MSHPRTSPEVRNGGDFIPTFTVCVALIGFILGIAWFLYSPYIAWGTTQAVLNTHYLLIPFSIVMSPEMADFIQNIEQYLTSNMDYQTVTIGEVMFLQAVFFRAISVLIVPLLIWRGISNLIFAKSKAFTRTLSLKDLAEIQSTRYPRVKPAIKAKLLEQDHRFGPWATSRNPLPYLIQHNLVTDVEDKDASLIGIPRFSDQNDKDKLDNLNEYHGRLKINTNSVNNLLIQQLGKTCQYRQDGIIDIDALPAIERTMAILFLAALTEQRSCRKKIEEMLDQFGNSFEEGRPATGSSPAVPHKIDLSGIDELWLSIKDDMRVKRALLNASKTHAYWTTFFTYLYSRVYDDYGTMISRDFIFLKPVNRTLYLLCNQVGLEMARAETCGIRAQYLAEKQHGRPILQPQLESVCFELLAQIQEEGWLHEDIVPNQLEEHLKQLSMQSRKDEHEYKQRQTEQQSTEEAQHA